MLLDPAQGVAIFNLGLGWSFGLETLLREEASAAGLHLYIRRGPFFTNRNIVFSTTTLDDDVNRDPLRANARAIDIVFLLAALNSLRSAGGVIGALANIDFLPVREAITESALLPSALAEFMASPQIQPFFASSVDLCISIVFVFLCDYAFGRAHDSL
mmetsp:Transcript_93743/g.154918  ORF Transcript_93743/g.154918 Transcript_93743/m.154918 type:complete len:158 (+) Transcript_93743:1-474(+)